MDIDDIRWIRKEKIADAFIKQIPDTVLEDLLNTSILTQTTLQ